MDLGVEAASAAWARLAGLESLEALHVSVDPRSPLAPSGWIGILTIGSTVTASVPRADLEDAVTAALTGLAAAEVTTPGLVAQRMPPTRATLGPAALLYPGASFLVPSEPPDRATAPELSALVAAVEQHELDESGVTHLESPVFVSRTTSGGVAAAAGYRRWANGVAHLSVLAHPAERNRGHGRRAAAMAIGSAMDEGLLPQWRARPVASQRTALALGFIRVGAQLSLQPA